MSYQIGDRERRRGVTQAMVDEVYPRVQASGYAGTAYEAFIAYVEHREKVRGEWVVVGVSPYMCVDGRLLEANADQTGYSILTYINAGDILRELSALLPGKGQATAVIVPPHAAVAVYVDANGGVFTGTSKIGDPGTAWGADLTNPLENAETSAVGRALGMAGFGLIPGSGVASADEVQRAKAEGGELAAPPQTGDAPPQPPKFSQASAPVIPSGQVGGDGEETDDASLTEGQKRDLQAKRRRIYARIADMQAAYPDLKADKDAAYAAVKAALGIAHLSEYKGQLGDYLQAVNTWFKGQEDERVGKTIQEQAIQK